MTHVVCPNFLIEDTEAECRRILDDFCQKHSIPRAVISFISTSIVAEETFSIRPSLVTDPEHLVAGTRITHGFMGYALEVNKTRIFPADSQSEMRFLMVDTRVIAEVVTPIHINDVPTGVVLIDYFRGESIPEFDETYTQNIEALARQISGLLNKNFVSDTEIRKRLLALITDCITETQSVRGYIALKDMDGKIEYFWDEDSDEVFLVLEATEGLCGRAFREGQVVNVGDVWKDPSYVASDKKIKSELVLPIVSDEVVIGIVNLESRRVDHYSERKLKAALDCAEKCLPYLRQLRSQAEAQDTGVWLSGFIEESLEISPDRDFKRLEIQILDCLKTFMTKIFGVNQLIDWRSKADLPPRELAGVSWSDRMVAADTHITGANGRENHVLYAPVRVYGELKAVVAVVFDKEQRPKEIRLLEQFCRTAGQIIDLKVEQAKSVLFEELIGLITRRRDSFAIFRAAESLALIMACDSCTVFSATIAGEKHVLYPIATTSKRVMTTAEMYYRIDESEGWTGYVASKKVGMVYDGSTDLSTRLISPSGDDLPDPNNKPVRIPIRKKMAEEDAGELSAFVALPLIAPRSKALIGVIRLNKMKRRSQRGSFDKVSMDRLVSTCAILSEVFAIGGLDGFSDATGISEP